MNKEMKASADQYPFESVMINLNDIRKHVISLLGKRLASTLTYHNVDHTLDVATQCMTIAKEEGVTNKQTLLELQIAALYHDTGFLYVYKGHEEKSCELARKELPGFGVNKKAIDNICEIILATKVPQTPKNLLQEIICDADLDYLGRNDYFIINEKLHKEFMVYKITCSEEEWKESRIAFLQSHFYFTKSSQQRRNPVKLAHLKQLIKMEEK